MVWHLLLEQLSTVTTVTTLVVYVDVISEMVDESADTEPATLVTAIEELVVKTELGGVTVLRTISKFVGVVTSAEAEDATSVVSVAGQ